MSRGSRSGPRETVLETIGETPLIRLRRVVDGARTPVYGKAEFFNPGGSLKDRIGISIVEEAEREGRLKPGGVIVEGTAGNTGIGLAIAAAVKGYRCIFTIPDKMSTEKVRLLKAFGAEVIVTPSAVGPDDPQNYWNVARRIAEERPNAILADQFFNPANPRAHYDTTGPEIWRQTDGAITHFVGGAGTGGTMTGVARYLKEQSPDVEVIAADPVGSIYAHYFHTGEKGPSSPYKVEGIGNDKLPDTLDFDVIDEFRVRGDREAYRMARRITREEGLLVGSSTGLIVHVAAEVAREVDDPEACIVCLLCDTGERYLSKLYNEQWLEEHQMLQPERMTADHLLTAKRGEVAHGLVSVTPETPVREALSLIEAHNVSQLPVLRDGRSVGSVIEGRIMSAVIDDPALLEEPVAEVSDDPFPVVDASTELEELSRRLRREVPAVLIEEEGEIVGILTRYDLLHHLMGDGR